MLIMCYSLHSGMKLLTMHMFTKLVHFLHIIDQRPVKWD